MIAVPTSRRRTTIRARLTFLSAVAVAVMALVVCAVTWFTLREALLHQVDQELDRMSRTPVVAIDPTELPTIPISPLAQPDDVRIQAFFPDGRTFRGPSSGEPLPISAADRAVAEHKLDRARYTVNAGDRRYRVLTLTGPDGSTLQLAKSLADADATLGWVGVIMLAVAVGAVTLAALAGRFVANAGLRPVNRLTRAATHIARTQDLHHPIPIDGRDEIAQVSAAFNTMIAALDESRKAQQELIEDAAHELRTPMSSLRTNIDLLVHAGARLPADDRQALIGDLHRQAAELSDLVADLVNLARFATADEPSASLDLAEVVTGAVERARARNPKALFDLDLPAGPLVVNGEQTALERAVVNLLDNAVKFGPPDQVVRVRVECAGRHAVVVVGDRAPVVPEGERERIFHRFHRLDSARAVPGSGLGLAIVYQTAAAHRGSVTVEPRDGGGNLFRLRLPT